jgi:cytochrome c peroxidase
MKGIVITSILMLLTLSFFSCKEKDQPVEQLSNLTPYAVPLPRDFPRVNLASDNPLTVEGVALGRMLYYEKALHPQGNMSCSNCHLQDQGFSISDNQGVLPHINLAWQTSFLWNGRIEGTLEDAMLFEVDEFFKTDLAGIKAMPKYREKYKQVFGNEQITSKQTAYALAQFIASLISSQSKYDKVVQKKDVFSPSEQRGYEMFFSEKADCFHCHVPPLFTDYRLHNIGIDLVFEGRNQGRYAVTNNEIDLGRMKTPTLRNIQVTGPYMHDGRFKTLDEVIEHYNSGIKRSASLDPLLTKNNNQARLNLSEQDKADLKAFLLTLTDTTFLNNSQHSNPF